MGLDDSLDDGQPEGRPLRLGCEERLKDLFGPYHAQPRFVIAHGHTHRGLAIQVARRAPDGDFHGIRARSQGVLQEASKSQT